VQALCHIVAAWWLLQGPLGFFECELNQLAEMKRKIHYLLACKLRQNRWKKISRIAASPISTLRFVS
jgi:hypothetical protein